MDTIQKIIAPSPFVPTYEKCSSCGTTIDTRVNDFKLNKNFKMLHRYCEDNSV